MWRDFRVIMTSFRATAEVQAAGSVTVAMSI
jgi:hypothetical protein